MYNLRVLYSDKSKGFDTYVFCCCTLRSLNSAFKDLFSSIKASKSIFTFISGIETKSSFSKRVASNSLSSYSSP